MSVATNHIKDCGMMKSWCDYAFFDTLENLTGLGSRRLEAEKTWMKPLNLSSSQSMEYALDSSPWATAR